MSSDLLILLAGALAGGLVSGLTGFGTGLTALPIWLVILPPVEAAALVIICSIIGQLQVLPAIWSAIDWRRVTPFIAGGIVGVPVGTALLASVSPELFRIGVGVLLILYCSITLLGKRVPTNVNVGRWADGVIGATGGVLGGIAGLSGVLPTLWTGLRGWSKEARRAVFQPFNLIVLSLALLAHINAGIIERSIVGVVVIALPATFFGVWLGHRIYRQLPDARYHQIVLVMLLIAGSLLVLTTPGL